MSKPTHDLCIISGEGKAAIWTSASRSKVTSNGA
jgi:hypothetical protein